MRDTGGDVSPRTSFFQAVRPGEVVVKQWNASTEQLEDASADVALEKERGSRQRAGEKRGTCTHLFLAPVQRSGRGCWTARSPLTPSPTRESGSR